MNVCFARPMQYTCYDRLWQHCVGVASYRRMQTENSGMMWQLCSYLTVCNVEDDLQPFTTMTFRAMLAGKMWGLNWAFVLVAVVCLTTVVRPCVVFLSLFSLSQRLNDPPSLSKRFSLIDLSVCVFRFESNKRKCLTHTIRPTAAGPDTRVWLWQRQDTMGIVCSLSDCVSSTVCQRYLRASYKWGVSSLLGGAVILDNISCVHCVGIYRNDVYLLTLVSVRNNSDQDITVSIDGTAISFPLAPGSVSDW